ncbi:MAG: efflux RND transporter periplasmic adaptor subunit [Pirellulales bacterium]|nr:efflux RND transporter periplasmic adaptor subunit [Pirellulales bacterium]
MTAPDEAIPSATENPAVGDELTPPPVDSTMSHGPQRMSPLETRRWWIKLFVQPALLLACGVILIVGLGMAQRFGFISDGGGESLSHASSDATATRYICPMMCTPPQAEPGRCPVCAMELVPASSGGANTDTRSIHVDPANRRVANIHTVAVTSMPISREIRAIGELSYDEGSLKTIAAYVDGRLDRLYADFTGVTVKQGDHLALLYSPQLYSGQAELLLAKEALDRRRSQALSDATQVDSSLYESTKKRLMLLGVTEMQIRHLEDSGKADSRLHLCAPISGTVIEKLAVEGQYVKEGDAIYRLADLSTVWLMLRLFPEDAASLRYGQKVDAEVQSLPGRPFTGRVAFIDPNVDPKTRTVGVRVVIPNTDGTLRVGDYAKATVEVPLSHADQSLVYDPELANKWISPRHPHVIAASPGKCPICGVELVSAAQFGFTDQPNADGGALVVPRHAVLMAGSHSVVYVETVPGRFEIRRVVLGPICGHQVVIRSGLEHGELVATRGNFLIDSQMQLAGNPSLIDPTKLEPAHDEPVSAEIVAALSELSPEDRALVERQQICPVAEYRLGAMGTPKKVDVHGTPVFICCDGCRDALLSEPEKYLAKLEAASRAEPPQDNEADTSHQMDLPPIGVPQMIPPAVEHTLTAPHTAERLKLRPAAPRKEEIR